MAEAERRLSTPLVLAASSGMLAVAGVVWLSLEDPAPPPSHEGRRPGDLRIDDRSPESAAQSFYDAWRRRRWDAAERVAVGAARREVDAKREADASLPREERLIAERTWDALAHAPLTLALDRVDILQGGARYALSGTAEYRFVGQPYRREVAFDVVRAGDRYRVEEMHLGEVLTELPDLFRGGEPAP